MSPVREEYQMLFDTAVNKVILGAEYLDALGIFAPVIKGSHMNSSPDETERTFPAILDISNNYEIRGTLNVNIEQIKGTSYSKDSTSSSSRSPDFSDQNVWINYGQNIAIDKNNQFPGLVVGGPSSASKSNNALIWAKRLIQNQNGYSVSDRRIKVSVKLSDYADAYKRVSNIPIKSYRYLDDTLNPVDPDIPAQPFGFIAHEVAPHLPNSVIDICGNFTENGALIAPFDSSSTPVLPYLSLLDKNSLFQLLFAAFKHSQDIITDLENRLHHSQDKITDLESRLDAIGA